jgi:hypothetical protein
MGLKFEKSELMHASFFFFYFYNMNLTSLKGNQHIRSGIARMDRLVVGASKITFELDR